MTIPRPTVSVLMAVYNGAPTVREAIESILNQTFTDFEFLVLDDASTDNTWEILQGFASHHTCMRLLRNENNQGLTWSLNHLLSLAQGDYIARQDADDVSLPERLSRQVQLLCSKPHTTLVTGNFTEIDTDGNRLRTVYRDVEPALAAWYMLFHNYIAAHSLVMFRRDMALHVGGYDETYTTAQDYELWLRLMDLGDMVILPDVLLLLRQHVNSVSALRVQEQFDNTVRASRQKLFTITGHWYGEGEVENLFGFWAPWKKPNRHELRAFNRRLREIYRGFNHYYRTPGHDRQHIRNAVAEKYVYWMEQEKDPRTELRLSLQAGTWSLRPVLRHWRRHWKRWLTRVWSFKRKRVHF